MSGRSLHVPENSWCLLCLVFLSSGGTVMMNGWFQVDSPRLYFLLFFPFPVCLRREYQVTSVTPPDGGHGTRSCRVFKAKPLCFDVTQWLFDLSPSKGGCLSPYRKVIFTTVLQFFFFLMQLMGCVVCSGSGKAHEGRSSSEYWIMQGKDPLLLCLALGLLPWVSCPGCWEVRKLLSFYWLAIYCFTATLLLSHRTIIVLFPQRMTSITLKINCSIVWKYLSWISLTLGRAEHPQPRKGGRAVPALNSALQMSVTCF